MTTSEQFDKWWNVPAHGNSPDAERDRLYALGGWQACLSSSYVATAIALAEATQELSDHNNTEVPIGSVDDEAAWAMRLNDLMDKQQSALAAFRAARAGKPSDLANLIALGERFKKILAACEEQEYEIGTRNKSGDWTRLPESPVIEEGEKR